MRSGLLAAAAVVLAASLAAAPTALAARPRAPRCPARGATVVTQTRAAVVFVDARTGAYRGCLRPHGRARRLATPDEIYSTVGAVTLAGRWVAFSFSHTPECKADCPPGVTGSGYVALVNLRDGRRYSANALSPAALALTVRGTLVYLLGDALHALDRAGDRVLDTGDIAPASVRASGTTVTWTNAGVAKSQTFP
ncbi:hypothetical protein [Conexibacter woesei]|uniref:Lipoprotein n=1 Tax=Conexibacter woesei (strain DSM 14684 / CCUG 47730 / CIP 108061 / JCM 11494 / NBRC 100937 / ID131577) TaxID=469383 RepID=D3FC07_CONWI|nr:hypothetical protein [Conexibacter woesei]ADB51422.1 hypothetical protein Cwoe_3003 [Conexibacter woesei DSM 14684]